MTNIDRLVMELELSPEERRRRAEELVRLRRLEAECRRHQRRLPHQVQHALRADAVEHEVDPPAAGAPGLFANNTH